MIRRSRWAIFLFLLAVTSPAASWAEVRVALVIGNSSYLNTPQLPNPVNDAADVAAALTGAGFKVSLKLNATNRQFDQALAQFARDAQGADVALFYFAGHGMQFRGRNLIMPVDAVLQDEFSLKYEMVSVDDVKEALGASAGIKILILDSCRDNPLASKLMQSLGNGNQELTFLKGLAPAQPTQRMVIIYATQSGQVAMDGAERNSPFAKAFLDELRVPGLEVATFFRNVAHKVEATTGGTQLPELSMSGVPEYFLTPKAADELAWEQVRDSSDPRAMQDFLARFPASAHRQEAEDRLNAIAPQPTRDPADEAIEALFWQSTEKGGTLADYARYLQKYPNGRFAQNAINRIAVLAAQPKVTPSVAPGATAAASFPSLAPKKSASQAAATDKPAATPRTTPANRASSRPRPTPVQPAPAPTETVQAEAPQASDGPCAPGYVAVSRPTLIGLVSRGSICLPR